MTTDQLVEYMLRDFSHSGDMKDALRVVLKAIDSGDVVEASSEGGYGADIYLKPEFAKFLAERE